MRNNSCTYKLWKRATIATYCYQFVPLIKSCMYYATFDESVYGWLIAVIIVFFLSNLLWQVDNASNSCNIFFKPSSLQNVFDVARSRCATSVAKFQSRRYSVVTTERDIPIRALMTKLIQWKHHELLRIVEPKQDTKDTWILKKRKECDRRTYCTWINNICIVNYLRNALFSLSARS